MFTLLHHQYPTVAHIFTHLVNLVLDLNLNRISDLSLNIGLGRVWTGFRLQNKARLELCFLSKRIFPQFIFPKSFKTQEFPAYICVKSLGPSLFRSKVTAFICGKSHQVVSPFATGEFGQLSPSKQSSKPPKLKYKTL